MANLVVHWVNEVGLSRVIKHPEHEFANGFLLGELLSRLHLIDAQCFQAFRESDDEDDKLHNFALVCNAVKSLKINFEERIVGRIITEQYGSAAYLIDKIRDYVIMEEARNRQEGSTNKALATIRPKAWKRAEVMKAGRERDFIEKAIDEVGLDNFKALDMALHLKRFEDKRIEIEKQLERKDREEAASATAAKHYSRDLELQRAHEKMAWFKDWLARGRKDWARNMRTKRNNFKRLLQYEICLSQQRDIRRDNNKRRHRSEEIDGINWFEMNMLRLGVGETDRRSGQKDLPTKEDAMTFLKRILAAYEVEEGKRRVQVADLMTELKEKAVARRKAVRERGIRRRKELCDQAEAQHSLESAGAESMKIESLMKKMEEEDEVCHGMWLGGAESALKEEEDRRDAVRELARQHRAQELAVADFFISLSEQVVTEEARRAEFRAALPGILESRRQAKHERTVSLVKDVVDCLVDFSVYAAEARGGIPLRPSQWQDLKDLFVSGHVFFPAKSTDEREEEKSKRELIDVALNAETVLWYNNWQYGHGPWTPTYLPRGGDACHEPEAPGPESAIIRTVSALTASDKPTITAPRPGPVPSDTPPIVVAVVGERTDIQDLCSLAQSLHAPNVTLVNPDLAISSAQRLFKAPTEQDKQALASSPAIQALAELGGKHVAVTQDPKNPGGVASDQLIADLIVAYIKAYDDTAGGSWMLAGYPATAMQAKLLERGLTGYSDVEVTEYVDKLLKAEGKKPKPQAKPKGKDAAVDSTLRNKAVDEPLRSGFDAVLVLSAEGQAEPISHWASFEGVPPTCYTLPTRDGQTADFVAEGLDLLLEVVEEEKAKKANTAGATEASQKGDAAAATTASASAVGGDVSSAAVGTAPLWQQTFKEKRAARTLQLSLAARMWREHLNGDRRLDLQQLRSGLQEPWETATATYNKEVHRAMSRLVCSLRPLRDLETDRLATLRWKLHAPVTGLADACRAYAARLSSAAKPAASINDAAEIFLNDVEVGLGTIVETRYDEMHEYVNTCAGEARSEIEVLLRQAEGSLSSLVAAEGRRFEAALQLISVFDELSNVSERQEASHEESPSALLVQVRIAEHAVQQRLDQVAEGSAVNAITSTLRCAVSDVGNSFERLLSGSSLSAAARGELCSCALKYLRLVDGAAKFWGTLSHSTSNFVQSMVTSMGQSIRQRTTHQHGAVSRLVSELSDMAKSEGGLLVPAVQSELERLGSTGVDVDERKRAPTVLGPTVLDSNLSFLPVDALSALVYALRSRASRSPLIKCQSFVRCVTECLRKSYSNGAPYWHDADRVAKVAEALDPQTSGMLQWRRFVHALILAHLPKAPTLQSLLTTRAVLERRRDDYSSRPPVRKTSISSVPPNRRPSAGAAGSMLSLRVTTGEFLELPLWFEADLTPDRAHPIKDLYALAFTEDDGKISLGHLLLVLCESVQPPPSSFGPALEPFLSAPLFSAAVLFGRPFRMEEARDLNVLLRAFDLHVGAQPTTLSRKVLDQILQHGTHLQSVEAVNAFMDKLLNCLQLQRDQAATVPLDRLLAAEPIKSEVREGGLFTVCPVYSILEQEPTAST